MSSLEKECTTHAEDRTSTRDNAPVIPLYSIGSWCMHGLKCLRLTIGVWSANNVLTLIKELYIYKYINEIYFEKQHNFKGIQKMQDKKSMFCILTP